MQPETNGWYLLEYFHSKNSCPKVTCILIRNYMHPAPEEAAWICNESKESGFKAFPDELDQGVVALVQPRPPRLFDLLYSGSRSRMEIPCIP